MNHKIYLGEMRLQKQQRNCRISRQRKKTLENISESLKLAPHEDERLVCILCSADQRLRRQMAHVHKTKQNKTIDKK